MGAYSEYIVDEGTVVMKSMLRIFSILALAQCTSNAPLYAGLSLSRHAELSASSKQNSIPDCFFQELRFSHASIRSFFQKTYNHQLFPQFLALNFHHVTSGAQLAQHSNEPRRFLRRILSLFGQKLQNVYVNPYAFTDMLIQLHPSLEPYGKGIETEEAIAGIKDLVSSCLVNSFRELKQNPDITLTKLAQDIHELVLNEQKDSSARDLQHAVHYFLARALMRLVWSPHDALDTWQSFKTIGALLEKYCDAGLIDDEMLNDLFWILVKQYSFFISLCGTSLRQEFYDGVGKDIQEYPAALWKHEESEADITSKEEYLSSKLIEAALTSRMHDLGHVIPSYS